MYRFYREFERNLYLQVINVNNSNILCHSPTRLIDQYRVRILRIPHCTRSQSLGRVGNEYDINIKLSTSYMAAWRNGIASDYDLIIRRLQVRPLRWSFFFMFFSLSHSVQFDSVLTAGKLTQKRNSSAYTAQRASLFPKKYPTEYAASLDFRLGRR